MAVTLTITQDDQGHVKVHGPINNQLLCYGLLGFAHDLIREFAAQQQGEKAAIVPPTDAERGIFSRGREM